MNTTIVIKLPSGGSVASSYITDVRADGLISRKHNDAYIKGIKFASNFGILRHNMTKWRSLIKIPRDTKLLGLQYLQCALKTMVVKAMCFTVTDMQHYFHARYPSDDWHLAYMFSLVYFSVEVCLVGVFTHSVSTRWDPCVRVCAPLILAFPLARKHNRTGGDPALHLSQVRGHLNWRLGLPTLLFGIWFAG